MIHAAKKALSASWDTAKNDPVELIKTWIMLWAVLALAGFLMFVDEATSPLQSTRVLFTGIVVSSATFVSTGLIIASLIVGWAIELYDEKTMEINDEQ